ncbi:MAG TPA: hypothetical protein DCG49_06090 [Ruminococcus sp.]|nr:hypothetical protein [Ruminococcus sp.]
MSSKRHKNKKEHAEAIQPTEQQNTEAAHADSADTEAIKTEQQASEAEKKAESEKKPDTEPNAEQLSPKPAASDSTKRRKDPVRTVTPADIKKPQVSFMNSIANVEAETLMKRSSGATSQAYDHAVIVSDADEPEYRPKIRRMNDSTRARELRRRQSSGDSMPYEKVTPVSVPKTLPASKLRKRKEQPLTPEELERIPDNLKAHPMDQTPEIHYISQAEHTQINLSSANQDPRSEIDIDVRYQDERRERTDLPVSAKEYTRNEDKEAILNDLLELKTSVTMRMLILGLLALCSALYTFLDWLPAFPMPGFLSSAESPVAFLAIQLMLGLSALPFSGSLLKNGYLKLLQFRADCDSLAAMSMMSAEIAAFLIIPSPNMLRSGAVSVYISVGLLSLFINAIGKKLIVDRAMRNFACLSDGNPKFGVHYVEDEHRAENLTRGTTGDFPIIAAMQSVEQPEDFLKYTFSTDIADKFCSAAVPIIMLIAIIFSVVISMMRADHLESAVCYGTSVFALCFSACACTAITLISNLPMASGTKDYVRNGGLLLGYQSVDDFYDINTVMLDAAQLFPRGTTKLESIQVMGESRIEEALQYAASLTKHAGSILKDLFANAILTEEQMLLPVENYNYDESKGISGWIRNKRVLLGTRDMMIEHSVEGLPPIQKVKALIKNGAEPLYLSVSGSISALFIVRLEAGKNVRRWLHELEKENLFLLVRSNDALLSQRRIAKMFGMREEHLKVLPVRLEPDFAEETAPVVQAKPSMLCAGRLAGFVQTLIGAKRIRSTAVMGMVIQAVTACLGLLFVVIFVLLGAGNNLCGAILLIYHVICSIITIMSIRMKDT